MRAGLALVLVRHEVVHLVLDDRAAERAADLLVLSTAAPVGDGVRGVELVVAEEAVERCPTSLLVPEREIACTWMPAERPCVMSNMLVTIWNSAIASRLNFGWPKPEPGDLLRDLLAVEVQLEVVVAADARRVADVVGRDALDHLRQLHPVAALQRQLLHLPAIDVAGDLRRRDVDERRFGEHRQRFADGRQLQRERDARVLADEHLDVLQRDRS